MKTGKSPSRWTIAARKQIFDRVENDIRLVHGDEGWVRGLPHLYAHCRREALWNLLPMTAWWYTPWRFFMLAVHQPLWLPLALIACLPMTALIWRSALDIGSMRYLAQKMSSNKLGVEPRHSHGA